MNYNLIAYGIYSCISFFIIFIVGNIFYRNGRIFILELFHHDEVITDRTNKLLLTGYYLLNLGYALVSIHNWVTITLLSQLLSDLAIRIGFLTMLLATIHYINMVIIYIVSHSQNKLFTKH